MIFLRLLVGFLTFVVLSNVAFAVPIESYQNEIAIWQKKWQELKNGKEHTVLRIVQIGDSHTAGDFFTDEIRKQLQNQLGNAGIGWIPPVPVSGQRVASVRYQGEFGLIQTSRKDKQDFPFGGIIMSGSGNTVSIQVEFKYPHEKQKVRMFVRPVLGASNLIFHNDVERQSIPVSNSQWHTIETVIKAPFSYTLPNNDILEIGLMNLENGQRGVTLSALGINGSQFSHWNKWQPNWQQDLSELQADLIILAYGTNEAFNSTLDIAQLEQEWRSMIRKIRSALPQSSILIVGAPESLKKQTGICGVRPVQLDAIQAMQQRLAKAEKLLYWSWQNAMGGVCNMKKNISMGLAAKDGVHFTLKGYRHAGESLAQALNEFVQTTTRLPENNGFH